jgi:ergothioneine biosynthesis protein EgtB
MEAGMTQTVAERLLCAWQRTDLIFSTLKPAAFLARPISLRHPFVFYVGHLPAFARIHICAGTLGQPSFAPTFDDMFSRGIDPDVEDPLHCHDHPTVPEHWPALDTVLAYRDRVRTEILKSIEAVAELSTTDPMAENGRVFAMVVEHELMHQETLLYMIQQLAPELKTRPAWLPDYMFGPAVQRHAVEIPAGRATLGADFEALTFGWDNEFPTLSVDVPAFSIDSLPVSNAEFLEFVESGAYGRRETWRDEDWAWKVRVGLDHPQFWVKAPGRWLHQTVFDLVPLADAAGWPAYVSLAEARAYARWRGQRLPTEAEFHRAAYGRPDGSEQTSPWVADVPTTARGNFDFRGWAPTPSGSYPRAASAWGVLELVGNGWEWTNTQFVGFPGFKAYIERYPGYSADFFDGKHYVLKGASWATAADLVRPSFRNWFQAHYPFTFAKFRCVSR